MIYVLKRIGVPDYGDYCGFVVRADTKALARKFVYNYLCKDTLRQQGESDEIRNRPSTEEEQRLACAAHAEWLRTEDVSCVNVYEEGDTEIILIDHLDG